MRELLEKIDLRKLIRYLLFMFLTLMAQNMVFSHIRIYGVCPLVLPAVAAAAGMFEGATWGPLFSLLMGYFADMSFVENRVFFLLLLPALSLMAAFLSQFFINRRFFAFMGAALLALLATGLVQMLLVAVKDSFSMSMLPTVALQTLWSLPLAVLAYYPAAHWMD